MRCCRVAYEPGCNATHEQQQLMQQHQQAHCIVSTVTFLANASGALAVVLHCVTCPSNLATGTDRCCDGHMTMGQ